MQINFRVSPEAPNFDVYYRKNLEEIIRQGAHEEFCDGKNLFVEDINRMVDNIDETIDALPPGVKLLEHVFGFDPINLAVRTQNKELLQEIVSCFIQNSFFVEEADWGKMLADASAARNIEFKVAATELVVKNNLKADTAAGKVKMALELSLAGIEETSFLTSELSSLPIRYTTEKSQVEIDGDGNTTIITAQGSVQYTLATLCQFALNGQSAVQETQSVIGKQQAEKNEAELNKLREKAIKKEKKRVANLSEEDIQQEIEAVQKVPSAEKLIFSVHHDEKTYFGIAISLADAEKWAVTSEVDGGENNSESIHRLCHELHLSYLGGVWFQTTTADSIETITEKLRKSGATESITYSAYMETMITPAPEKTQKTKSR